MLGKQISITKHKTCPRVRHWKGNNHKNIKKPPENVQTVAFVAITRSIIIDRIERESTPTSYREFVSRPFDAATPPPANRRRALANAGSSLVWYAFDCAAPLNSRLDQFQLLARVGSTPTCVRAECCGRELRNSH